MVFSPRGSAGPAGSLTRRKPVGMILRFYSDQTVSSHGCRAAFNYAYTKKKTPHFELW